MTPIRLIALLFVATAVSASAYVGYWGYGGESRDLDRSVRIGSFGGGYSAYSRVK
ncbi:hypothetical protein [Epibacterium sp. Ofav1-8]|uniref:hypothetical protein n=1 Tax=Epibacterium sp. Ofav1-8 TaxID=2917735 RepID=UPI001EF6269B|nr:hypothetical protein [Epibacterium sp. Ofav1-8]MCG7625843.1 hypothetical protein [Epibacterium sp. Ofav1-8]